jgi:hypothetical protein
MVLPRYYNVNTGKFSGIIPANEPLQERGAWVETSTTEENIRKIVGTGVSLEYSGTNRMYLAVTSTGRTDVANKQVGGVKESLVDVQLPGWDIDIPGWNKQGGVGVGRAKTVTTEIKSGGDFYVASFKAYPFENKMALLGLVDTHLEKTVRSHVERGLVCSQSICRHGEA